MAGPAQGADGGAAHVAVLEVGDGEDHLRVVADLLRLVGEVVGGDADAVAGLDQPLVDQLEDAAVDFVARHGLYSFRHATALPCRYCEMLRSS